QGVLKMIPGLGKQLEGMDEIDERQLGRVEAIILSMTPQERGLPKSIDGSRRKRIANGSGTTVEEVNRLLDARKQIEKLMKGDSKFIEIVGRDNPKHDPSQIEFDEAKVKDWHGKGALPSEAVRKLLKVRNLTQ